MNIDRSYILKKKGYRERDEFFTCAIDAFISCAKLLSPVANQYMAKCHRNLISDIAAFLFILPTDQLASDTF